MALDPRELLQVSSDDIDTESSPMGGTRRQRTQRLQVGIFGLAMMIVLVALADIIISSAEQNRAGVPEELPPVTTEDLPPPAPRDPLVEAGVVPNLPVDGAATPEPAQTPAPSESDVARPTEEAD